MRQYLYVLAIAVLVLGLALLLAEPVEDARPDLFETAPVSTDVTEAP